jgi:putative transposase
VLVPKVGWVAFKRSRALPEWKSYRVTRDRAGRWHIAFAAIPEPIPAPGTGEVVGVDRGVKAAVALSTGDLSSPAGLGAKEAERLLRLQRRLARAERGSNRRGTLKVQIARLRTREADRRKDWVEKTSTNLARRFDVIRVEDLNVQGMTRSARGTLDAPGRNVPQKAALHRGILAAGWSALVTRLEHKPLIESRRSTPRTRRRPVMPAGMSHRPAARTKRCSGASPVGTATTRTSTQPRTSRTDGP